MHAFVAVYRFAIHIETDYFLYFPYLPLEFKSIIYEYTTLIGLRTFSAIFRILYNSVRIKQYIIFIPV